ncbi:MAG: radical SAM protein, partial [Erysipelotrichaceae bacterium]|nr:radical SAM protein [Erysipelotrichaceae bacterium]
MKIGLIDVDGHHFPNLALMRISAYHKAQGDTVEWWWSDFEYYDIVYMSKIFSDIYSKDIPEPLNCGKVIKGGTGYCIYLGEDGKEHFDQSKNVELPAEMEKMFPDYSIYPEFDFALAMTSRGCPRGCSFCHVAAKEGQCSVKVANVSDFWNGQKEIKVLDPNITACREKRDLMKQYRETGVWIDFTQGIDIRLTNEADIDDLNGMKIKRLHFAWDNPKDDLEDKFRTFSERFRVKDYRRKMVYCLTN